MSNYEWLEWLDVSGPFLAEPVLKDVFPQGLEDVDSLIRKDVRQAYAEWRDAKDERDPDLTKLHGAWIDLVLGQLLELDEDGKGENLKRAGESLDKLKVQLPAHGVELTPDRVLVDDAKQPLMLVRVYPPGTPLDKTVDQDGWAATSSERMVHLCRAKETRLGLVTNGEQWLLVDAPIGAVTSFASWYAGLWGSEPLALQSFVSLLRISRFLGVDASERLPALLDRSIEYQDEVTDALGEQVRRAVEVLIQALDRADQDRNRELLKDVAPRELYEAGLTVMMRLVFLLSAEERDLLLLGDERYDTNYAVSTLRMQLRAESDDILERRQDAWSRLLAIFRAVYGGIEHENLRMPALGGSLFDPDRFPFLEGRDKDSNWQEDQAKPLPIDNRTVLLLLESIQVFQGRTLSYRGLDIEQLGYVYEGLLDHTVKRAKDVTLELDATQQSKKPWVTLGELGSAKLAGEDQVKELLVERTGSSNTRVINDLAREVNADQADQLLSACGADGELRERIKPYFHLLRTDSWGLPLVYPKYAFMVTTGDDRRQTGSHYTPTSLTEAIVKETLEPVIYIGPAEGKPQEEWQLKSAEELLELKICDPAMGSGAFLVQVCRWLGERVVEAWGEAERQDKAVTADGVVVDSIGSEEVLSKDAGERSVTARRLIAERCIYGVDINPLAVELAKLSIWLVTLAKGRPFGFLDHNLRSGDSLLGIHDIDQLRNLSMDPEKGQQQLFAQNIGEAVDRAVAIRRQISGHVIRDIRDVEEMADLDEKAREVIEIAEVIADAFVGEVLEKGDSADFAAISILSEEAISGDVEQVSALYSTAQNTLAVDLPYGKPRRDPFHWALGFPEVFNGRDSGFDAIVGNPPFLGGQKITGAMGESYREFLVEYLTGGLRGSADLVVYFFVKAYELLKQHGSFGLIAVNTIAEGNTREASLDLILAAGGSIFSAYPSEKWQGKANVVTSRVHLCRGDWQGQLKLSGESVDIIAANLTNRDNWNPVKIKANSSLAFMGSIVLGDGFLLKNDVATAFCERFDDSEEVILPYIIGKEVNQSPDHSPGRWVINYWDWSSEKAESFSRELFLYVKDHVYSDRQSRKDKGAKKYWWLHHRAGKELYHRLGRGSLFDDHPSWCNGEQEPMDNVIVLATGATKYPSFTIVPNDRIFANTVCVIASDSYALFASLSSDLHAAWAWEHGSRMKQDLRYTHGDVFETFPFPAGVLEYENIELKTLGKRFFEMRRDYMLANEKGMTKFYNDFHDPAIETPEINALRELQVEINDAVIAAYGFEGITPDYGFHEVAYLPAEKNLRFTVSEQAREELLFRLAMLNKERHESEGQSSYESPGANRPLRRVAEPAQAGFFDEMGDP